MDNYMELKIPAESRNEAFARNVVAAFCVDADPTIDEIDDIKTVVSEAVTNCIVHAYSRDERGEIVLRAALDGRTLSIEIEDFGIGIGNVEEARKPFFTSKTGDERSGMGFTIMESFTDRLEVIDKPTGGVLVKMSKEFRAD